jgi:uncharacterized Fe-S cluster-containing radical SAM superfamily protein
MLRTINRRQAKGRVRQLRAKPSLGAEKVLRQIEIHRKRRVIRETVGRLSDRLEAFLDRAEREAAEREAEIRKT